MTELLYLTPFLVVAGLVASGRVPLPLAGLAGLAVMAGTAAVALEESGSLTRFYLEGAARGSWLAWQAISVMLAGLFFYRVIEAKRATATASEPPSANAGGPMHLFTICFLIGPFLESATGFGVGAIIVLGLLQQAGLSGPRVVALSLFSQLLVPWGALGIGTKVGAEIADLPLVLLGTCSAWLVAAILISELFVFWWLIKPVVDQLTVKAQLEHLGWVLVLGPVLILLNKLIAVPLAGMLATGLMWFLKTLRDGRREPGQSEARSGQLRPYGILVVLLLATRSVPAIETPLKNTRADRQKA